MAFFCGDPRSLMMDSIIYAEVRKETMGLDLNVVPSRVLAARG